VTTRYGTVARAVGRADEDEARVRSDLVRARHGSGLSRDDVGKACGLSRTGIERLESGTRRSTVREYAALGAAVGLDVRLRAYPAGDAIRDAGQQRLLVRFRRRLHTSLRLPTEVPLPNDGDLRAWDAMIRGTDWRLAVEAETVLGDIQAVERRIALKRRDGGIDHVILVVADTPRNRRALAAAPTAFAAFSRDARATLRALAAGANPGSSAILIL
jgi:transcriptional regulator with XRE-family HTH domain